MKRLLLAVVFSLSFIGTTYAAEKTPTVTTLGRIPGLGILMKAVFTDLDDTDYWPSGIKAVPKLFWFARTDNPSTQASAGYAVAITTSTFFFYPAEDNTAGNLYFVVN
jgi:hypothetical protein